MTRFRMWILGLFLLTGSFAATADAQTMDLHGLRGLSSCAVLVEDLGAEAKAYGLTTAELTAMIELRLRQNGIRVIPMGSEETTAYIYFNLNVLRLERTPLLIFSTELTLNQAAYLQRSQEFVMGATWSKGVVGVTPREHLESRIHSHINETITFFLNDYFAQNPR